jgi:ribosomal protein S18 acetylase RimI-like enzyme
MHIELRPACEADRALLLALYASTRAAELALTGWSEAQRAAFVAMQFEAQRSHYLQRCPRSHCQLILVDAHACGRLWVDRRSDCLHVLDISLLPERRGRGVGTYCLRRLAEEAQDLDLGVSIYVERDNPARHLYERLGFMPEGGLEGFHQRMVRHPTGVDRPLHEESLP